MTFTRKVVIDERVPAWEECGRCNGIKLSHQICGTCFDTGGNVKSMTEYCAKYFKDHDYCLHCGLCRRCNTKDPNHQGSWRVTE